MRTLRLRSVFVLPLLCLGCAQGGEQDRPEQQVKIEANHHMFGFSGRHRFSEFPIKMSEVLTDRGTLIMKEDSTYRIQRASGTSGAEDYALQENGLFDILINQGSSRPRIRFLGAYGLEGATNHYYFTDRYLANPTTSSVGLFFGVRIVPGTANLEAAWHLLSLHVIFSKSLALNPNNLGRAVHASIAVDAAGMITGSGFESTKANLTFGGEARSFDDGQVDLALIYADAQSSDNRLFKSGASPLIVVGVDEMVQAEIDAGEGEAGLIALVKKRTGMADRNLLAATYNLGGQTIFMDPTNAGFDASAGTLTFNAAGAFRLEAVGTNAVEFAYSGTYKLDDDGTLTLAVDGTSETWKGAVDQDYKTVFLVDNFLETRTGNKPPELSLFMAVRPVPAK